MCSPGCAASGDGRPSRGRDRDNVVATSAAATTASHRAPPTPSAAPHRHCGPGRCARLGQLLLDTKRIAPRPGAMRSASKRGVLWGIAARRCRRAASLRLDAQHAPMRAAQAHGQAKGPPSLGPYARYPLTRIWSQTPVSAPCSRSAPSAARQAHRRTKARATHGPRAPAVHGAHTRGVGCRQATCAYADGQPSPRAFCATRWPPLAVGHAARHAPAPARAEWRLEIREKRLENIQKKATPFVPGYDSVGRQLPPRT